MKRRKVKRSYNIQNVRRGQERPGVPSGAKRSTLAKVWWRGVWHYILYLGLAVLAIYFVLFSNIFQIHNISVQVPNTELSQDLHRGVEQYLSTGILGRNWLFLNTNSLRSNLQKSFSGQESITVDKIFPSKLVIKTDEQKAGLIWRTGARRFVVSVNGRVMSELQPSELPDLPIVIDTSNIPLQVGDQAVSRQFVAFTTAIYQEIKTLSLGPAELMVHETTGELIVNTNQKYAIRFDATVDSSVQIESLRAILSLLQQQNKKPLEYIDLRIPNRAFYK